MSDLWGFGNINPVKSLNRLWLGECNKIDVIIIKIGKRVRDKKVCVPFILNEAIRTKILDKGFILK